MFNVARASGKTNASAITTSPASLNNGQQSVVRHQQSGSGERFVTTHFATYPQTESVGVSPDEHTLVKINSHVNLFASIAVIQGLGYNPDTNPRFYRLRNPLFVHLASFSWPLAVSFQ